MPLGCVGIKLTISVLNYEVKTFRNDYAIQMNTLGTRGDEICLKVFAEVHKHAVGLDGLLGMESPHISKLLYLKPTQFN